MLRSNQKGFFSFTGIVLLVVLVAAVWFVLKQINDADATITSTSANAESSSLPFGLSLPFSEEDPSEFKEVRYRIPSGWLRFNDGSGYKLSSPKGWVSGESELTISATESFVVESPDFIETAHGANDGARIVFMRHNDRGVSSITDTNAELIAKQQADTNNFKSKRLSIDGVNAVLIEEALEPQAKIVFYDDGNRYSILLKPVFREDYQKYFATLLEVASSFNFTANDRN